MPVLRCSRRVGFGSVMASFLIRALEAHPERRMKQTVSVTSLAGEIIFDLSKYM
jgi:hypothetical protein